MLAEGACVRRAERVAERRICLRFFPFANQPLERSRRGKERLGREEGGQEDRPVTLQTGET